MNPLGIAIKGKGVRQLSRRIQDIGGRYGLTTAAMRRALSHFQNILDQYGGSATFPVTAAAVERNRGVIESFKGGKIEFAVHGYYHVDHSQLTTSRQTADLTRARRLFAEREIPTAGFRCPYLRLNGGTLEAVREAGFIYDSSRSQAWDVLDGVDSESYQRALSFYGAERAEEYPSLPWIDHGLVEIPYSLPDDEALWDRLPFGSDAERSQPWLKILIESHRRGELFNLGLHPERIFLLEKPLRAVLEKARELTPGVWFARLEEIARWWLARASTQVEINSAPNGMVHLTAQGPEGLTILARGVQAIGPAQPWDGPWQILGVGQAVFMAHERPLIGVSAQTDAAFTSFLRQQGFITEVCADPAFTSIYFHRPSFQRGDERAVLAEIESSEAPLVRFGRWPNGAKSALTVSGDIDALTIRDYFLRFIGR